MRNDQVAIGGEYKTASSSRRPRVRVTNKITVVVDRFGRPADDPDAPTITRDRFGSRRYQTRNVTMFTVDYLDAASGDVVSTGSVYARDLEEEWATYAEEARRRDQAEENRTAAMDVLDAQFARVGLDLITRATVHHGDDTILLRMTSEQATALAEALTEIDR